MKKILIAPEIVKNITERLLNIGAVRAKSALLTEAKVLLVKMKCFIKVAM